MGLRITHGMLLNYALQGINRNSLALNRYREQLSTGFRINRPSDDPITYLRMLPLQSDIQNVQIFQENGLLARDVLNTAANAFENAQSVLAEARRLAVQGANGTLNNSDRTTLARSVDQLLQEMVSLANSKFADRTLFAGSATSALPFVLRDGPAGTFVTYDGNDREVTVEVAPDTETMVGTSGRDLFMRIRRGATRFTGNTGAVAGSGTDSGRGQGLLSIEHTGFSGLPAGITAGSSATTALGQMSFTISAAPQTISIGGGPAVPFNGASTNLAVPTANDDVVYLDMSGYAGGAAGGTLVSTARMSWDAGTSWANVDFGANNQQILHAVTGEVLNVDPSKLARVGEEEITFDGTFDAFNVLIALRDVLQNERGLPPNEVAQRVTALIGDLDTTADNMLEGLREYGTRSAQLDLTRERMAKLELTMEEALSRDRDIDLSETILHMTQRDVAYQSSLAVGARVISTTLLDFLS